MRWALSGRIVSSLRLSYTDRVLRSPPKLKWATLHYASTPIEMLDQATKNDGRGASASWRARVDDLREGSGLRGEKESMV